MCLAVASDDSEPDGQEIADPGDAGPGQGIGAPFAETRREGWPWCLIFS